MPTAPPVPRLNLWAPGVLLGLCYRALAADADPLRASLTARKLAHLQSENTELLKTLSSLNIDVQTAGTRALTLKHDAHQNALDVELFEAEHPPAPKRRGLFKPKPTPEERRIATRRAELAGLAAQSATDAADALALEKALAMQLAEAKARRENMKDAHSEHARLYQEQLAAGVLDRIAAGDFAEAEFMLAEARQLVRGDLMVATLLVLTALFSDGVDNPCNMDAALEMLGELKTIFHQHDAPVSRVLALLIAVARGRKLTSQEVAALVHHDFDTPALNRLSMLLCAIDGWAYGTALSDDDPLLPTLNAVQTMARLADPPADWQPPAAESIVQSAQHDDPILHTITANILLQLDATELIPQAVGIDFAAIEPPRRRRDSWPTLSGLIGDNDWPAWPDALGDAWRGLLCSHLLLAARGQVPDGLFDTWLAESYDWPKGDFYWWMLAVVKDDATLKRNISGDAAQLTTGIPL